LKVKVIFINDRAMDNAPAAGSRGLSSSGAHRSGDPRHRWYRVVARCLAKAIRGRSQEDVLAAAALAASVVEQESDGTSAARRGVNLLDLVQIAPGPGLAPDVRALLEQAAESMLHATSGTPAAVAERLRRVLHEVAIRKRPVTSRLKLPEVPAFVAEHLHEGTSLADLARRLGYSPSHCSTLVRRATGERFSSLRRRVQLERAIGLLRSGTSVKEAALGAGFSEPAYFSRVFARRFGVPPSRWREALR
jgi:AraC-like DNA-binding protein